MNKEALFLAAKEAGIEAIEVLVSKSNTTSIEVYEQAVDSFKISNSSRLQFRGIYQGRLGTCTLEEDLDEHIPFVISSIQQSAMAITSEDVVEIYDKQTTYPTIHHTPNNCLQISVQDKIAFLKNIETQLKASDPRIDQVMGVSYQDIESGAEIANSYGIKAQREEAYSLLSAAILVSDQEDKKSAYDVVTLKDMEHFNVNEFVQALSQDALSKLHGVQVESGTYPVIIDRKAMADMLRHFASLFDGEDVAKGISILHGLEHQAVLDKKITIVDDPLMIDGYNSASFDDEGVACFTKTLVKDGVIQGFLQNLKSAHLSKVSSSGNGFGNAISPTNLYIQNGTSSKAEMIQSIKKGLLINELNGLHAGYNELTTQFSLQASGFYIEDGNIAYPVNLITIAGNLFSLLKDVDKIGNDLKFSLSGVGAPSILFSNVAVSGK